MLTTTQRARLLRARRLARNVTLPTLSRTPDPAGTDDLDLAHTVVDLIDEVLAEPADPSPSPWIHARRADDPEPDPQTDIEAFLTSPRGESILRRLYARLRQEETEQ